MPERRKLQQFFETASDLFAISSFEGYFVEVNPAWSRLLGWTRDELLSRPIVDFVHADYVDATLEAQAALRNGQEAVRFVNQYRTKGGEYRTLEWSARPDTETGWIYATARDISREIRAAARSNAVEHHSGVGSWRLDLEVGHPEWSDVVFQIHEVPVGLMPPLEKAINFFPPGAREVITKKLQDLQARGVPYEVELPFITAKGRHRIVHATGALEPGCENGTRMYGTIQDITEIKRYERRLSDIIAGTNAGTWEWNIQTGECIFNERWADIIGYSLEELGPGTDRLWTSLAHPDDVRKSNELLDRHIAGEMSTYECEVRMRHKNGEWIWVLDLGRVSTWTPDGKPEWISGTHIDITQRKEQEAEYLRAREEAVAANEAKSRFLAAMSHEIRTPLNGVLGMADVLSREIRDPSKRAKIQLIKNSGEALVRILNDILDFSKIEAGKIELAEAPFVPEALLKRVADIYEPKARESGIGFSVVMQGETGAHRVGDEIRLAQILNNLISNAIKFTNEGEVKVSLTATPENVEFVVQDTGIGMSAEALETIFDAFTQADASITRRFGGTGLGMSITRRLADLMNGTISVESEEGAGTTVTAAFPLPVAEVKTDQANDTASDDLGPAWSAGRRVLVADDNQINLEVLGAFLRSLDFECHMVPDGQRAIAAFTDGKFDLVILDIQMPDMGGGEVLAGIRALEARSGSVPVPVFACTANVMPEQVRGYLNQGFDACVAKPVSRDTLARELRNYGGRARTDVLTAARS